MRHWLNGALLFWAIAFVAAPRFFAVVLVVVVSIAVMLASKELIETVWKQHHPPGGPSDD